ncbi:hypothetical protein GGI12_003948 [Dipsacomyces acuminosporus]|nr:hypothetical protein GGI12_003948 [Dipsacomyces acuminosporus]
MPHISAPSTRMSSFVPRREMLYDEAEDYRKLQRMAYEYDNYATPLIPKLGKYAPNATKLTQLQCIPIVGNIIVLSISLNFALKTRRFEGLGNRPFRRMLLRIMLVFFLGFIPFVCVYATYKLCPLYTSWTIFSSEIDAKGMYLGVSVAGRRAEFPTPHNTILPENHIGEEEKWTEAKPPMPAPMRMPEPRYISHTCTPQPAPAKIPEPLNIGPPEGVDERNIGYYSCNHDSSESSSSTLNSTEANSRATSLDGEIMQFTQHHVGGFLDLSSPTDEKRPSSFIRWLRR